MGIDLIQKFSPYNCSGRDSHCELFVICLSLQQRGRQKEEELTKKIQEMVQEEEKLRIPIAQGLPCTTDEPEVSPL